MKKMIILILAFMGTLPVCAVFASTASQIRDDARDMLRSESEESENDDATSRWGQSVRKKNAVELKRSTRMMPIESASFAQESNRAPASVASASREPAAMPEQQPANSDLPPQAMIREAKNRKAFQETAIIANDQGFFPSTVFVTQGIPVRLFVTGASAKSQCIIMDSFGVRRQIQSQKIEEISFTPENPGTYTFNCPMNGARGAIVVKEIDPGNSRLPASE